MPQLSWTFNPDKPVYTVREELPNPEIRDRFTVQAFRWARTIICRE